MLDDPAAFGFDPARAGTPCAFVPGAAAAGCAGYIFWDGVHPTAATHRLTGALYAAAVPTPGTMPLLAVGLLAVALGVRSPRRSPRHAGA